MRSPHSNRLFRWARPMFFPYPVLVQAKYIPKWWTTSSHLWPGQQTSAALNKGFHSFHQQIYLLCIWPVMSADDIKISSVPVKSLHSFCWRIFFSAYDSPQRQMTLNSFSYSLRFALVCQGIYSIELMSVKGPLLSSEFCFLLSMEMYQVIKFLTSILLMLSVKTYPFIHCMTFSLAWSHYGPTMASVLVINSSHT